ncbi:Chromosome transmission fidelity protein 8 [Cichlidogyrus casuarinus]|uniref:Chromosome transmission fidelity protein 8 n=1 Tax=Cichlidogyrus casuarinus TaxID=1844966 RepID=A0ABD2QAD7_9PLAT
MNEKNEPYLLIGHQILTGKIVKLEKPLLVAKKEANEVRIKSIIQRKLLFNTRPKPIIDCSSN